METIIVHQGRDQRWRWHAVDLGNRKIIATSGQSFASEFNARRAAEGAKSSMASAPIEVRRPAVASTLRPVRRTVPVVPAPPVRGTSGATPLADVLQALTRNNT